MPFNSSAIAIQLFALVLILGLLAYWMGKKYISAKKDKVIAEEKLREVQLQLQMLEVETMKHKLNPHLFKNVLNSIQSHAYQTYQALDKLAGVLDYILYESDQQLVAVVKEISFAQNLIDINRLKLSPLFDLRVKIKVNEDTLAQENLVAPLICAPFIENAFKHADIQSDDAFIAISLEYNEGVLKVHVANKVTAQPTTQKQNSGIGNKSLAQRLELFYGRHYKLEKDISDRVYKVFLTIDLIGYKHEMFAGG